MRDQAPHPQAPDIELVAGPACCSGGTCGPVFETPLLELAFNRIRDVVRGRSTTRAGQTAGVAPPRRRQEDASHD